MSSSLAPILSVMPLSQVYRELTGIDPRPSGIARFRARAIWRNGDGFSVSIDDGKSVWHDFVTHEGGRTLDLIGRARGCPRREALRWFLDLTGLQLRNFSQAERGEYRERQRRIEKTLPVARRWQTVAVPLSDELLFELKGGLNGRTSPWTREVGEIRDVEHFAERVRHANPESLIAEYEQFLRRAPRLTSAMIRFGNLRLQAAKVALERFWRDPNSSSIESQRARATEEWITRARTPNSRYRR